MKRLQITKYGFIRWPEECFSECGIRHHAYHVGEHMLVEFAISGGELYTNVNCCLHSLPTNIKKALVHYNELNTIVKKLNCLPIESVDAQDLVCLYDTCLAYEKDYVETVATFVWPTFDDVLRQAEARLAKRNAEATHIAMLLAKPETLAGLSEKRQKDVMATYRALVRETEVDPNVEASKIFDSGNLRSYDFCSIVATRDSWQYTDLLGFINS